MSRRLSSAVNWFSHGTVIIMDVGNTEVIFYFDHDVVLTPFMVRKSSRKVIPFHFCF